MSRVAISVTREGEGMDALMDSRFGRAEAFLVVDRETGEVVETLQEAGFSISGSNNVVQQGNHNINIGKARDVSINRPKTD